MDAQESSQNPLSIELFNTTDDPNTRFRMLERIGKGSFGSVYSAIDRTTGETVAIKKMSWSGGQSTDRWWIDVQREVSIMSTLKHANLVELRVAYLKETRCFLVMEYCIGSAADILLVHKRGLNESEIAAVVLSVVEALVYLHGKAHIHRDVKASNVLLTEKGAVKLADFGSAFPSSTARSVIGSALFMAPEVIRTETDMKEYTSKADIWSLGVTCIELAERHPPHYSANPMSALYRIAEGPSPSLSPVPDDRPAWSPDFVRFVDDCLKKSPEERMSSAVCRTHPFLTPIAISAEQTILALIARTRATSSSLPFAQLRPKRTSTVNAQIQCIRPGAQGRESAH